MKLIAKKTTILLFLISFLFVSAAYGTEFSLSWQKASKDNYLKILAIIDQTDNIAGIKVSLQYDPKVIKYYKMTKTKATSPLMHIVNDKTPGTLIIVMAGAKGIKGKKLELFNIAFEKIKKNIKTVDIKISTIELISDKLKEIKCQYNQFHKLKPFLVSPATTKNHSSGSL